MIWYWLKKAHPSFLCFWCTINFAARSAVTLRLFTSSHFASVCVCVTVKICSMTSWEAASSKWMSMCGLLRCKLLCFFVFINSWWETSFYRFVCSSQKNISSLVHLRRGVRSDVQSSCTETRFQKSPILLYKYKIAKKTDHSIAIY